MMNRWMDALMNRNIDGSMNVWKNWEIHVHVDGWMNSKIIWMMDEWMGIYIRIYDCMNGRIDEWNINYCTCTCTCM